MRSLLTNSQYMLTVVPSSQHINTKEGLIPIDTRRTIHLWASLTIADDETVTGRLLAIMLLRRVTRFLFYGTRWSLIFCFFFLLLLIHC